MTKENKKFEKIVRGIEKIHPIEEELIEKERPLNLSVEREVEQLWALWNNYRHGKYGILIRERKQPKEKRRDLKSIEESKELIDLKKRISDLWQNKGIQLLFKKHLEDNLKERGGISPNLKDYHYQEEGLTKLKESYEEILQELFVRRAEEPDELIQMELAETSIKIEALEDNLNKIFQESPDLASFIQFEKIKEYHRQYEEDGFIWVPSRKELFEKILTHMVLLDKNRPLLLTGETGTGKTRLARASIKRITNRSAFEIGEEAKSDIRPLLGSASIEKDKTYVAYGQLGQALIGKKTSLDKESDGGGIFYMDEMNGYPPDALRSLIKQVSGRAPGEEITFAAWRGIWEKIAEKSGIIGSSNLPSEKHPDRSELPVEIIRELVCLEVDYPEQTKDNPELYEMMLAGLMDKNSRLRLKEGELESAWQEKVDPAGKEKIKELDPDVKAGGTLWRFANLVGEIQKSYKGEKNILTVSKGDASYLQRAVLDPGIVLSWLREYRISRLRKGEELKRFLQDKLKDWSGQKTYPKEDRDLLKEFFIAYNLPIDGPDMEKSDIKGEKIWSEAEIGALSPRVPRPKEEITAPRPASKSGFLEDGTEIEYQAVEKTEELVIKNREICSVGKTPDGKIVLEDKKTKIVEIIEEGELEDIRKESSLEQIRGELESCDSADELDSKIKSIINYIITQEPDSKEQKKYQERLKKQIRELRSKKEKIDFILSQLR